MAPLQSSFVKRCHTARSWRETFAKDLATKGETSSRSLATRRVSQTKLNAKRVSSLLANFVCTVRTASWNCIRFSSMWASGKNAQPSSCQQADCARSAVPQDRTRAIWGQREVFQRVHCAWYLCRVSASFQAAPVRRSRTSCPWDRFALWFRSALNDRLPKWSQSSAVRRAHGLEGAVRRYSKNQDVAHKSLPLKFTRGETGYLNAMIQRNFRRT